MEGRGQDGAGNVSAAVATGEDAFRGDGEKSTITKKHI
jgi:hypothetical protein